MALTFTPSTGSTIPFGTVAVGARGQSIITLFSSSSGSITYAWNSTVISGPQASQFSFNAAAGPYGPYYAPFSSWPVSGSGAIVYSPTATGAAAATFTVNYTQYSGKFGSIATPETVVYSLTGTGGTPPPPPTPSPTEYPGLVQSLRYLLVPVFGTLGERLMYFDTSSGNDPNDGSVLVFKMEDLNPFRVPTMRRVMIAYYDLGAVTLTVTITSVDDNGNNISTSQQVTIGTLPPLTPTGILRTAFVDIAVTGFRPQLSFTRAANAGQVMISQVMEIGVVEDQSL